MEYQQNPPQPRRAAVFNQQVLAAAATQQQFNDQQRRRVNDSAPAFDSKSVASSRPGTSGNADGQIIAGNRGAVRKVQSSAFELGRAAQPNSAAPRDHQLQAKLTMQINQNSGQLHAPRPTNKQGQQSRHHSF